MGPSKPQSKRAEKHQDKTGHLVKNHHGKTIAPSKDSISINATKSKIRNVRRVLSHSNSMPEGIRIEKERALAGYKQDLEQAIAEKKRNEMIGKYHMVRFFERRKAERALKKARARLSSAGLRGDDDGNGDGIGAGERDDLIKQVHVAEVDVNYTLYYPLMEKYVSLYPKGEGEYSSKGGSKGKSEAVVVESNSKPPVWTFVEQCMTTGTLDMLRDGKYGVKPDGSIKTREEFAPETNSNGSVGAKKKKHASAAKMGEAQSKNEVDEDESDGGFFEK